MITEETTEDLLVDLFQRHAEDRADAGLVLRSIHEEATRPRSARTRPVLVLAIAAAVAAIALVSTFAVRAQAPDRAAAAADQAGSVTVTHPGEDQLTKTCLDMPRVLENWGNPQTYWGGIAVDLPDGSRCSHEADIILPTHPATVSSMVAGTRTVYIAQSPADIHTGFINLNPAESAAAAAASGGTLSPGRSYYLIVSIPADNPATVLASILQQFKLPG